MAIKGWRLMLTVGRKEHLICVYANAWSKKYIQQKLKKHQHFMLVSLKESHYRENRNPFIHVLFPLSFFFVYFLARRRLAV